MNKMHTLSDNQIEKYMKEFELSKEQIIQMHEDFLGIPRQYTYLDSKTLLRYSLALVHLIPS